MTPERWKEVKKVLAAALELEPGQRAGYLDQACAEPLVRREVESLIVAHEQGDSSFMEGPILERVPLESGTKLGPYEILALVGAGGMGEVYQAHDTKLGRDVAIKVLPEAVAHDAEQLSRFEREAKILASLNHPNIAVVYGLEEAAGRSYLVMELVSGETLAERISKGALPLEEALGVAGQVAEALEAAHKKGVIHRDLKPANVKVTPEGRVKVLDFGLAKALAPDGELDRSPGRTLTAAETIEGRILGTPAYMSPEQARGRQVDKRTDIWAFGVVLYELLTARRPFAGETLPDTLAAVLEREPDWQALPTLTPARVRNVLRRCLEKDPQRRLGDIGDALIELKRTGPAREWKIIVPALALVIFGTVIGAWFLRADKTRALNETDKIVLADISNSTGDAVFDETLKQALSVQLAQSPFLDILSDQQMRETLRLMGRRPSDRVNGEAALEICQRVGAAAFLSGSIASLGSEYVIGLSATSCRTGDLVAQEQVQARQKEDVLKALGQGAEKLRGKLGESLSTIERFDRPIEQATTPSLEALKSYSLGMKARAEEGDAEAIPWLKHAIELDPNFAMAYAELGVAYDNLGEPGLASERTKRAFELRDRVSEREKFRISSVYFGYVIGDLEKEMETYKLWTQSYPRDAVPQLDLSAIYGFLGQYEKALPGALEALRLDPSTAVNYENLMGLYLALNRLEEAKGVFEQAQIHKLERPALHLYLYGIAFLRGDTAEMERQAAWGATAAGAEDSLLSAQSDTEAFGGQLERAREHSQQAFELARRHDQKETAALWKMNAALREAEFGNAARAKEETASALALAPSRDVQTLAALVLARAGDLIQSQRMADDLESRFPSNTLLNHYWLPTIRAAIEANRGQPAKALEFLAGVVPYELGEPPPLAEVGAFLYPVYLRGQAYMFSRRPNEAAEEFRKFLDHRSIVANCPLGALARVRLARAYASQGDVVKSRAAYEDFFAVWKNADPTIPILRQAKAEYAKLQ